MNAMEKELISVEASINAPLEKVWKFWTMPEHIINWNAASEDWHTPSAENDVRVGGSFKMRMEAKDGSVGFDFGGVYTDVKCCKMIEYVLGDGREVKITFTGKDNETKIVETFEAENVYSPEQQKNGWQAIMNNFKKYVETN
jgi:uncharacterized protein YndB with AHSA1/START domain